MIEEEVQKALEKSLVPNILVYIESHEESVILKLRNWVLDHETMTWSLAEVTGQVIREHDAGSRYDQMRSEILVKTVQEAYLRMMADSCGASKTISTLKEAFKRLNK
jgi:hypothetical protein